MNTLDETGGFPILLLGSSSGVNEDSWGRWGTISTWWMRLRSIQHFKVFHDNLFTEKKKKGRSGSSSKKKLKTTPHANCKSSLLWWFSVVLGTRSLLCGTYGPGLMMMGWVSWLRTEVFQNFYLDSSHLNTVPTALSELSVFAFTLLLKVIQLKSKILGGVEGRRCRK